MTRFPSVHVPGASRGAGPGWLCALLLLTSACARSTVLPDPVSPSAAAAASTPEAPREDPLPALLEAYARGPQGPALAELATFDDPRVLALVRRVLQDGTREDVDMPCGYRHLTPLAMEVIENPDSRVEALARAYDLFCGGAVREEYAARLQVVLKRELALPVLRRSPDPRCEAPPPGTCQLVHSTCAPFASSLVLALRNAPLEDVLPSYRAALAHGDGGLAASAREELSARAAPEVVPFLLRQLESPAPDCRQRALELFAELLSKHGGLKVKPPEVLDAVRSFLTRGTRDERYRASLALGLPTPWLSPEGDSSACPRVTEDSEQGMTVHLKSGPVQVQRFPSPNAAPRGACEEVPSRPGAHLMELDAQTCLMAFKTSREQGWLDVFATYGRVRLGGGWPREVREFHGGTLVVEGLIGHRGPPDHGRLSVVTRTPQGTWMREVLGILPSFPKARAVDAEGLLVVTAPDVRNAWWGHPSPPPVEPGGERFSAGVCRQEGTGRPSFVADLHHQPPGIGSAARTVRRDQPQARVHGPRNRGTGWVPLRRMTCSRSKGMTTRTNSVRPRPRSESRLLSTMPRAGGTPQPGLAWSIDVSTTSRSGNSACRRPHPSLEA